MRNRRRLRPALAVLAALNALAPRRLVESAPPTPASSAPTFTDVTAASGIGFRHENSPTTSKYLIETMGGGVAVFDYDNDGRLDVFFVNGAALADPMPAGAEPDKSAPRFANCLYRNKGDGTFDDVTRRAGLAGVIPESSPPGRAGASDDAG